MLLGSLDVLVGEGSVWTWQVGGSKTCKTHSWPSYHCIIANTSIGVAILFSCHPYIGTHYCLSLIHWYSRFDHKKTCEYFKHSQILACACDSKYMWALLCTSTYTSCHMTFWSLKSCNQFIPIPPHHTMIMAEQHQYKQPHTALSKWSTPIPIISNACVE